MLLVTLSCPQCGAPLPRQARWRTVACQYCGNDVTRSEEVVAAAEFHQAWLRAQAAFEPGPHEIRCLGQRYRRLAPLGIGSTADVLLAERISPLLERVVLKIAHAGASPGRLKREMETLRQLQAAQTAGAAYFSQRLPQPVGCGVTQDLSGQEKDVLVLRNPTGFWGSLADVKKHYPAGIDPRHAVWMWRRMLEVLGYLHQSGWAHGNLAPEHLLVHPGDHGILIIGWADAKPIRHADRGTSLVRPSAARDLVQSAWAIRAMLSGGDDEPSIPATTPAPFASLLKKSSEDASWCATLGAAGLNQALVAAARASFGPPQFIHFTPTPSASSLS